MKGGKRHIVTDTLGLLLWCVVHAADIQDRDRARITINEVLERFPSLKRVFADGGGIAAICCPPLSKGAIAASKSSGVRTMRRGSSSSPNAGLLGEPSPG